MSCPICGSNCCNNRKRKLIERGVMLVEADRGGLPLEI